MSIRSDDGWSTPATRPREDEGNPRAELGDTVSMRPPLQRMWALRWMATFLVAFAVVPAILLGGSDVGLVLLFTLVPLGAFGLAEHLAERRMAFRPRSSERLLRILMLLCAGLALFGYVLSIAGGFGSVSQVVYGYEYSTAYSVSRMLTSITPFALALAVNAEYRGAISTRAAWLTAILLLGGALIASVLSGYLGGALVELVVFLVLATWTRMLRWRAVIALLIAALLVLPGLFSIRDNIRQDVGLSRSSEFVGPFERFRVDTQTTLLKEAVPSSWVAVPDIGLYVRTALVPRFLDPERPILDIGRQMNFAVGNSSQNNISFGHYGTVFWLYGLTGVVVVAALLGGLYGVGARYFDRLWGVAILAAVAAPAVWPEITFPDYVVGFVQFWQICAALIGVAYVLDAVTSKPGCTGHAHHSESIDSRR